MISLGGSNRYRPGESVPSNIMRFSDESRESEVLPSASPKANGTLAGHGDEHGAFGPGPRGSGQQGSGDRSEEQGGRDAHASLLSKSRTRRGCHELRRARFVT